MKAMPAGAKARAKGFSVNHVDDSEFEQRGLRNYFEYRDLGIASYGFAPFVIPEAEETGTHGNNERISIDNIRKGTEVMLEIVRAVAAAKN